MCVLSVHSAGFATISHRNHTSAGHRSRISEVAARCLLVTALKRPPLEPSRTQAVQRHLGFSRRASSCAAFSSSQNKPGLNVAARLSHSVESCDKPWRIGQFQARPPALSARAEVTYPARSLPRTAEAICPALHSHTRGDFGRFLDGSAE